VEPVSRDQVTVRLSIAVQAVPSLAPYANSDAILPSGNTASTPYKPDSGRGFDPSLPMAWAGIPIDGSERRLRVDSGQLGDFDRAGLLTLPPLGPGHHHIDVAAAALGADERPASTRSRRKEAASRR
jgi:hypothetical protein